MEDLIPVLIFIAIVFGSVIKKIFAKQAAKSKETPARDGWIGKLNAFFDDIQKRIEAQQPREDPASADQWRQLMEKDAPSRSGDMEMADLIVEHEDDLIDHPREIPIERKPATDPISMPGPAPQAAIQPGMEKSGPIPLPGIPRDVYNLRQAVVWAEIIGPPVALREPAEDRF